MANPIDGGMVSPPAPRADAGQSNALMAPVNALAQPGPQAPAPSHAQTCAALRHFSAVMGELHKLSKNPDLGRSDVKGLVIDSVSKLVAQRVLTPASAVVELSSVPEDPLAQRKWVKGMMQKTAQAQNAVLDHHVAGTPGSLDWATESQHAPYNSDDHHSIMTGLAGNYRPSA